MPQEEFMRATSPGSRIGLMLASRDRDFGLISPGLRDIRIFFFLGGKMGGEVRIESRAAVLRCRRRKGTKAEAYGRPSQDGSRSPGAEDGSRILES